MVDASEPPFDIHNVYMQLRKVIAFVRWDLSKFRIILLQRLIAIPLIRYNFSVLAYPPFKEWAKRLGRSVVNNLGIRTTKVFVDNLKGNDNKALVLTASSYRPFLCATNEELVHMDFSCKRIVARALHRLLYLPFKLPAGLLTEFIFLGQFFRGHAFFLGANLEGNMESEQNREFALVEHGASGRTFVILAPGTSTRIRKPAFAIVRVAAFLANILATLPFDSREVFVTGLLRDEMLVKT